MLLALALCLLLQGGAGAKEVAVTVDGRSLEGSIAEQGITYVPLTTLLEAMGGWEVSWDQDTRTARVTTDLFSLSVPAGQGYVTADGYSYPLTAATRIRAGRTYVPLRPMANLLGGSVAFSGWDKPISVTSNGEKTYTEEDFYWLSRVISAESRGENLRGQIAVGNVVINRVASSQFPSTIKDVVFDTKDAVQFEPTANGTIHLAPTPQSILAARLVLAGAETVEDCLYFFNPSLSQGTWIRENCSYYTTIGCHRFYR